MIIKVESGWLKTQIERDLMQMIRKLRSDFRRAPTCHSGYAVLSFVEGRQIKSLALEIDFQQFRSQERRGREWDLSPRPEVHSLLC